MGEVGRILSSIAALGETAYHQLQKHLQKSGHVHGEETSWRENGQNGYLWSFSISSLCYFTYPRTRAGSVVTDVLGTDYPGIVVSDFFTCLHYRTLFLSGQPCLIRRGTGTGKPSFRQYSIQSKPI